MRLSPLSISLALFAMLAVGRPAVGTGPIDCTDYRGKGRIRVLLQPDLPAKAGAPKDALGRVLREAKSAHVVGKEKVLDYDCDITEADSKELIEKLGGLVDTGKGGSLRDGKTKAWVASGYGVPAKLEMYTAAGNLGMNLTMDELRFNTGVKPEELRLDVPAGTKKVSIDVDLAEKDWQQKMGQNLRKAMAAASVAHPRS